MLDYKLLGSIYDLILNMAIIINLQKSTHRIDGNYHVAKSGLLEINDLRGKVFINDLPDRFNGYESISKYLVENLEYDDITNTFNLDDKSGLMEESVSYPKQTSYYALLANGQQYALPIK